MFAAWPLWHPGKLKNVPGGSGNNLQFRQTSSENLYFYTCFFILGFFDLGNRIGGRKRTGRARGVFWDRFGIVLGSPWDRFGHLFAGWGPSPLTPIGRCRGLLYSHSPLLRPRLLAGTAPHLEEEGRTSVVHDDNASANKRVCKQAFGQAKGNI